jgi:hypothetical protein
MSDQKFRIIREATSAPEDFYVDSNCCTACGVPQVVAPDLVGWTNGNHLQCRWMKQPSDPAELEQAFAVFDVQELGCHRYAGTDPEIQKRIGYENCDFPPPGTVVLPSSREVVGAFRRQRLSIWSKQWRRKRY